ncbi:3-deoxy-manno-octulosonate cytidylyltransferase [Alphaproteobacteria bacterium]|nr:3-deoxy-manno-octulosonate cytidylyltransferase [Alphaproteobacteria bacterium]MDC1085891.1 3-deoxy-manno-octulosonate cytidylyltransferase [Alphaproteobacteria bacterium]
MGHKTVALIPARWDSSRLPGKALKKICGVEMIVHVAKRCALLESLDRVVVCTDSMQILEVCEIYNIEVCLTSSSHKNGTERIAEAANIMKLSQEDIIVDVQGDEVFVRPEYIEQVVKFMKDTDYECVIPHQYIDDFNNVNRVKLVAHDDRVIYLSRSDIPCFFGAEKAPLKKHLSIIGFRLSALLTFIESNATPIENIERIELMRLIELGVPVGTFLQTGLSLSVDTNDDYELACRMMDRDDLFKKMYLSGGF